MGHGTSVTVVDQAAFDATGHPTRRPEVDGPCAARAGPLPRDEVVRIGDAVDDVDP